MGVTMSFVSYHCHSTWSDGKTAIPDLIAGAAAAGLLEFGLSDHFALTPYTDTNAHEWSMPSNGRALADGLADLRAAAAVAALPVRVGVEADFFPETWAQTKALLETLDLDYVIASVHSVERFPIDSAARYWEPLSQAEIDRLHRGYWERLRQLAECRLGDIVGHLDLPKKFGFYPAVDLSREIGAALDAIAAAGLTVELNTAGWDKPCAAPYPAAEILLQVRQRGIPVLLSADAHAPGELTRHYARGAALLRQCGFTTMRAFTRRQPRELPIPA
jgi:histidinol-phosphatase (PHP family)